MGVQSQFYGVKGVAEVGGADGRTPSWMCVTALSGTLHHGGDGTSMGRVLCPMLKISLL